MKKITALLLTVLMLFACVSVASAAERKNGDVIEFGSYPQTMVRDEALKARLDALDAEYRDISLREYYTEGNLLITDVTLDGVKYRGVKLSDKYLQFEVGTAYSYDIIKNTQYRWQYPQLDIGMPPCETSWFRYEPIKWRILDVSTGLCIAGQGLDNGILRSYKGANRWCDNYQASVISKWVTDEFIPDAFTPAETAKLLPAEAVDDKGNSITDPVFLPSREDLKNPDYGFNPDETAFDEKRDISSSEYARSQGVYSYFSGTSGAVHNYYTTRTTAGVRRGPGFCWAVHSGVLYDEGCFGGSIFAFCPLLRCTEAMNITEETRPQSLLEKIFQFFMNIAEWFRNIFSR